MKTLRNIFLFSLLAAVVFAGVRPKDEPAASSPASDDKILIDGTTNGVRALDWTYFTNAGNLSAGTLADARIAAALTGKTYNALTPTALATGFSIAGGTTSKTATFSNTLTFAGTDSSTLNIGAGGTLGSNAYTTARTITGTSGQITVTNGDGVSGNPTLSLPSTITQATTFSAGMTIAHNASAVNFAITNTTNLALMSMVGNASTVTTYFSNVSNITDWAVNRNPLNGVFGDTNLPSAKIRLSAANSLNGYVAFFTTALNNTDPPEVARFSKGGNLIIGTTTDMSGSGGLTVAGTTSGTSTTAAAILGKSMGLTENLYVGGLLTVANDGTQQKLIITSSSNTGTVARIKNTGTNGRDWGIGGNFDLGNGEFSIYDYTSNTRQFDLSGGALNTAVARFYATTEATTGGAAGATFAGGIYAAKKIYSASNILSTSPTAGIGYDTGAGGTVTQATSRTTGVTLNKVCGSITLVSAAGTTSWQTFTVTDSAVAATDTIRVVEKSGTDLYQVFVTAIAAGSFNVSFATTGGTTTEQPVFNFSVFKAVNN